MRMRRGGTRLLIGWVGGTENVRYRENTSIGTKNSESEKVKCILSVYSIAPYTQTTSSDKGR